MIFHASTSLGAASNAVKNLQTTLLIVRDGTGNNKYDPMPSGKAPDGVVYRETVQALVIMALAVIKEFPVVNLVGSIPVLGTVLDKVGDIAGSDNASRIAWAAAEMTGKQDEIIRLVKDIAAPLDIKFLDVITRIRRGEGAPTTSTMTARERVQAMLPAFIAPTLIFTPESAIKYPSGAVAVRDPSKGVYRILIPS